MNGGVGLTGQSPWAAWMSVWHRPQASILTRTCPAAGSGIGRSWTSRGWVKSVTTAAFMGVPPGTGESLSPLTVLPRGGPPAVPEDFPGRALGPCGPRVEEAYQGTTQPPLRPEEHAMTTDTQ